jgi:hypothetical protein
MNINCAAVKPMTGARGRRIYLMYAETGFKFRQLTICDLVVAVTDAALEVTQDEDQAYEIASLVLMKLLQASASETAEHLLAACDDKLIH